MLTNSNSIIDCRKKNCKLKYSSIADNYKSISYGKVIRLLTNKSPKRMFFELLKKDNGNFYWVPIKDGPDEWDILIQKLLHYK